MSALDDGDLEFAPVTDLVDLARSRQNFHGMGIDIPLQDAERAAGLTEADVWAFINHADTA